MISDSNNSVREKLRMERNRNLIIGNIKNILNNESNKLTVLGERKLQGEKN